MEGNMNDHVVIKGRSHKADVVEFVKQDDITSARTTLANGGFNELEFSDGEIILAIQEQKKLAAQSIIPVVLDWLVEKNFILTPSHAINVIHERMLHKNNNFQYQVLGKLDTDSNGKFYLVAAKKQVAENNLLYKVYTHGKVMELWME